MRRFSTIVLILISFQSLVSGETLDSSSAADTAIRYVESFMDGRIPEAYLMLAEDERDGVSLSQFEDYVQATFPTADLVEPVRDTYPSLYRFVLEHLYECTVLYTEQSDDSILVHLKISTIDLLALAFEVAGKYPEVESDELSTDEINAIYEEALAELYGDNGPPRTIVQVEVEVSAGSDRLVVSSGIRKSFDRMRAGEIAGDAWEAKYAGRIEYALMLYNDAVSLDLDNTTYREEQRILEQRLSEMKELLAQEPSGYAREYLSIESSYAEMSGFPEFICTIFNRGETRVYRLDIRIAYLDELGLLMAVEIGRHDFSDTPLEPKEERSEIDIRTFESPFTWSGDQYTIEILRENP